jgi:hypothetical protein
LVFIVNICNCDSTAISWRNLYLKFRALHWQRLQKNWSVKLKIRCESIAGRLIYSHKNRMRNLRVPFFWAMCTRANYVNYYWDTTIIRNSCNPHRLPLHPRCGRHWHRQQSKRQSAQSRLEHPTCAGARGAELFPEKFGV